MSTAAPLTSSDAAPRQGRQPGPALQLVDAVRYAPGRTPFVILIGGVLSTGLLVVLLLHTLAAQDGFRLHALQARSAALADSEQQLTVATQQARSPVALATRARALGMVPTDSLGFLRLRDGQLMAVTRAVPKPPVAKPVAKTVAAAGASKKTGAVAAAGARKTTHPVAAATKKAPRKQ